MEGHIILLSSISSQGSGLTMRQKLENLPVSFWQERVLSFIIAKNSECQIANLRKTVIQVLILRGHIKKSHGRTYVSFVINLIIRVSSNPEEKIGNLPVSFERKRALYQLIGCKRLNFKLWGIVSKNLMEGHIILLSSISSQGSGLTMRQKLENLPVSFWQERRFRSS